MVKAGNGFDLTSEVPENIGVAPNLLDIIMSLFPSNIFESFAQGNLIHIVIFGLMIGITTLTLPKPKKEKLEELFQLFAELMRKLVDLIMYLAPLCLGALAAATIGEYGSKIMGPLLKFIGGVYTAQILMIFFYMLLLYFIGKVSPLWFLKKTSTLYYTTIATCSSLASLAVSLKIAETKLQLPKKIYGFTLPLGAQFNKDGTAIMLSAVLIFTAQAVGWQLTLFDIIQVIIVGLIVVEGSGGIPGGGLVVAMIFAKAFNLPLEVVAVVGGIYRLIDMGNTTVNCMGDLVGTVLISKQESKWLPESK
jgi:Na+/H+-dicarboxylate symporter